MAYTVDWIAKVFTIPLGDLTFVSGNTYSLDTSDVWIEIRRLEASPTDGLGAIQALEFINTQTLSGEDYSAIVKLINGYTWNIDATNINVSLTGKNSNLLDTFIPGNGVSVIANNSAGKTDNTDAIAAVTADAVMAYIIENGETFIEQMRLIRAEAAGDIVKTGTVHEVKAADGVKTRITANADADGRDVTAVDST